MGSRAVRSKETPATEVAGLVLFALAALLLLSQFSYSPWEVSFIKEPPNPTTNWVGPVGLHAAWVAFMGCGAAAYLLPLLAAVGGALAFWTRGFGLIRFLILGLVMVLAAAGLADWAEGMLGGWAAAKELESPGGVVGEALNRMLLGRFLGPVGAPLVLVTIYFTALILLLRIRPLKMIRDAGPWILEMIYRWQMARADVQMALGLADAARRILTALSDPPDPKKAIAFELGRRAKLEAARDYLRRGEYTATLDTLEELEQAWAPERMSLEVGLLRAKVFKGRGEYPRAVSLCRRLLSVAGGANIEDARAELLYTLIETERAMGRTQQADREFARLLEEHPLSEAAARGKEAWGMPEEQGVSP